MTELTQQTGPIELTRPAGPIELTRPARPAEPAELTGPFQDGSTPTRRRPRRVLAFGTAVVVILGILLSARVVWVTARPVDVKTQQQQVHYLQQVLAGGGAERMQGVFSEGYVFTEALAGLAAGQRAQVGDQQALAAVHRSLVAVDSPAGLAPFTAWMQPPHGVFWSGWSLLLAVEQARLSGIKADRLAVRQRAGVIRDALRTSDDGWLESYPGQFWPVDTVVAVAALARADRLVGVPNSEKVIAGWESRTEKSRDPKTGLLPHQVAADGSAVQGPRGSSQALVLAFEPDIDPAQAAKDYRAFVATFVQRRLGLLGVREFPAGTPGAADEDSGPLLFGISLSASAVALAAADRQHDTRLTQALNAQAELLALPVTVQGGRRYGAGLLPVGDAFLAWARAQPTGSQPVGPTAGPRPLWPLWIGLPWFPGLLVLLIRRRGPAMNKESDNQGLRKKSPELVSAGR
jgi:hypothetical protein